MFFGRIKSSKVFREKYKTSYFRIKTLIYFFSKLETNYNKILFSSVIEIRPKKYLTIKKTIENVFKKNVCLWIFLFVPKNEIDDFFSLILWVSCCSFLLNIFLGRFFKTDVTKSQDQLHFFYSFWFFSKQDIVIFSFWTMYECWK